MSLQELTNYAFNDTLAPSLAAFWPEVVLCATIVAMLVAAMFGLTRRFGAYPVMMIGVLLALGLALATKTPAKPVEIFTGMLVHDTFALAMRRLLLLFTLLFAAFTRLAGVPEKSESTEFYVLTLGAILGMCLMVSANHMMIVFLGIEMASVPSYVLVGFLRRRQGTEAALKFAVFGGGTAGVMLYGISLLVGTLGSAHLPTMAARLATLLAGPPGSAPTLVLALGGLMLMVGIAFKLSAVPFHFWAPDAFEGASAEVAAFLSIASKAAALALLVRLTLGLGHVGAAGPLPLPPAYQSVVAQSGDGSDTTPSPEAIRLVRLAGPDAATPALEPARQYMGWLVALLAALTCTFGNLAAYGQTNMKRLLAYSTIGHAGYMMMPVAAAVFAAGGDYGVSRAAVASLVFYISVYIFMNLGAFALVAFLRNEIGSEEIADYAGLVRRSPGVVVCAAVILFSLVGLPPLAGFAVKFAIFARVLDAGLLSLVVIGVLNTVVSLFYYLRVVKVMALDPEPQDRPAPTLSLGSNPGFYLLIIASLLVIVGIWWDSLYQQAQVAASSLLF